MLLATGHMFKVTICPNIPRTVPICEGMSFLKNVWSSKTIKCPNFLPMATCKSSKFTINREGGN